MSHRGRTKQDRQLYLFTPQQVRSEARSVRNKLVNDLRRCKKIKERTKDQMTIARLQGRISVLVWAIKLVSTKIVRDGREWS